MKWPHVIDWLLRGLLALMVLAIFGELFVENDPFGLLADALCLVAVGCIVVIRRHTRAAVEQVEATREAVLAALAEMQGTYGEFEKKVGERIDEINARVQIETIGGDSTS